MAHIHDLIDFTVAGYVVFNKKVLLILHKKLNLWLPPGGHIELYEDPEEALIREIKEECGLDVTICGEKPERMSERTKPLHVPAFLDIHNIDDHHRHIGMQYVCESTTDQIVMNEDELTDIKWFTLEEVESSPLLIPEVRLYAAEAIRLVGEESAIQYEMPKGTT